jgi:outer membrane immunogenic protein
MKRLFLACASLLALAGSAAAADLPPPAAAPNYYKAPPYVPAYTWNGFYIGVNGGGAWGTSQWDSLGSFNTSGGLVGGTVGYNYQVGHAVFGVEGDIDWADIQGSTVGGETKDSWLSTVRGRLGYAADRFMPYITAGGAFGDIQASAPGLANSSATNAGWTVGGGLEFSVVPNVTLKAEYLYVDLGKFNCAGSCLAGAGTDNVSFTTNIVRAGLNYHF